MPRGHAYRRGVGPDQNGGKQTDVTRCRLRQAVGRADLPAVAETRRILRDHLRLWGVPGLVDTAELLATELVTNALQHTAGGAVLTATLTPGPEHLLRVEVRDYADRRPRVGTPESGGDHGTSGRGLLLVAALADAWGVSSQDRGKMVWFELSSVAA